MKNNNIKLEIGDVIKVHDFTYTRDEVYERNQEYKENVNYFWDGQELILSDPSECPHEFRVGKYTRFNPEYWMFKHLDYSSCPKFSGPNYNAHWEVFNFYINDTVIDQIYEKYESENNKYLLDTDDYIIELILGGKTYKLLIENPPPRWFFKNHPIYYEDEAYNLRY